MDLRVKRRFDEYYNAVVSPNHRDATLLGVDEAVRCAIAAIARQMREVFCGRHNRGVFLTGPKGVGKTSVLALLLKAYLRAARCEIVEALPDSDIALERMGLFDRVDVGFCTHEELVNALRSDDFTERMILRRRVMFIDDFGRGYDDKSGWNLSRQDDYFDRRWRNRCPTFMTSNLSPKQLRSWQGWDRVVDRIADPRWMEVFIINSESKRK